MACSQKTLELEATALSASQLLERWHQKKTLNKFRKLYPLTRFLIGQFTVAFGVAKFDYVRVLFYGDNRNIFSWFLFCQFGLLAYQLSHFEVVGG